MSRWILAILAGLFGAGAALANGPLYPPCQPYAPGCNWNQAAANGTRAAGAPAGQGGQPGVLGPWYLYWPLEAHFITPAHPQFPYWPSPQTLHGGQPDAVPPMYAIPSYWK
jgi:hypothetical protein